MEDTAAQYDAIQKQINESFIELHKIQEKVANYKITFGKHNGKTLAEIAHRDSNYYWWLKKNNLIPFTLNAKIDLYVRTKINQENEMAWIEQYNRMKEEQGYVGRYIM